MFLNYLGNYLPGKWNFIDGCTVCSEDLISLDHLKVRLFNFFDKSFVLLKKYKSGCVLW